MYTVVLVVNLLICITLIGLVLLQRSEGGALGMGGGGGGGALMSGRGAADALARMTSVAGGLFLVCSFLLTFIAQADRDGGSRSFMLSPPAQSAPATPAPQRESSLPRLAPAEAAASSDTATTVPISAPASAPIAPSPTDAQTRAGPVAAARPTPAATTTPARPPAATTTQRTAPTTTTPSGPAAESRPRTTAVTQPLPESVDAPPSEPTRRERAGPDQ